MSSELIDLQYRKACLPCTIAKRRCDKGSPICYRCTRNKINCQYPSTRRYVRNVMASRINVSASQAYPSSTSISAGALEASVEPQNAQPTGPVTLDMLQDLRQISPSPALPSELHESTGSTIDASTAVVQPNDPNWFLGPDGWLIDHLPPITSTCVPPPTPVSILKHWIDSVRAWLRQWINMGHNPFMHRYLYCETGFPPSLQDAWMALATYHAKTKENEGSTLSIIEAKAQNLLLQRLFIDEPFMIAPVLDVQTRLAQVQSLFIFQFMRLFDGDIRQRALAEREIPTLTTWCEELWQSASVDAELSLHGGLFDNESGNSCSVDSVWRRWVLSESVRRIWLLVNFMHGAYLTLRDGWTECTGAPKFTARRGLWDATSSTDWAEALHDNEPLFTPFLQIDRLVSLTNAEIDDFSTDMLIASVGPQKVHAGLRKGAMSNSAR